MAELVCDDFTCKGQECTQENCSHLHPKKVGELKKETVNVIGELFLKKRVGLFNEWHFLKVLGELPEKLNYSWEGRMATPVRHIDQFRVFTPEGHSDISEFCSCLNCISTPHFFYFD
jgi:hypothetical protein